MSIARIVAHTELCGEDGERPGAAADIEQRRRSTTALVAEQAGEQRHRRPRRRVVAEAERTAGVDHGDDVRVVVGLERHQRRRHRHHPVRVPGGGQVLGRDLGDRVVDVAHVRRPVRVERGDRPVDRVGVVADRRGDLDQAVADLGFAHRLHAPLPHPVGHDLGELRLAP